MNTRRCGACDIAYAYPIESCTFCGGPLDKLPPVEGEVLAVTEVSVPSLGHEDVPYWCALVRGADGRHAIVKRDQPVSAGERVARGAAEEGLTLSCGIVGSGVMARGLAELLLSRGHRLVWVGRSLQRLESARVKVVERLGRVMDEEDLQATLSRLRQTEDMGALAECDLVIEVVVEDLEPKKAVIEEIERHVSPACVVATNTSALPLDALSADMKHPERFGGMHFFNPPTRMRLVEVVRAPATSGETDRFLAEVAVALGRIPVRVAAGPGFVVNRVLMPLLNEAVRTLEDGIAPAEDIDEAVRLGLNHPMGPLALADLIGLDVVVSIMEDLHARLSDEAYAPRPLLRELVAAGKLGRKTGEGFYRYAPPPLG